MNMVEHIRKESEKRHAKMVQELAEQAGYLVDEGLDAELLGEDDGRPNILAEREDCTHLQKHRNTVASNTGAAEYRRSNMDRDSQPEEVAARRLTQGTHSHISKRKSVPDGGKRSAPPGSKHHQLRATGSKQADSCEQAGACVKQWVCWVDGKQTSVKDTVEVDGETVHLCRRCSSAIGYLRVLGIDNWPKMKKILKQNFKSWGD